VDIVLVTLHGDFVYQAKQDAAADSQAPLFSPVVLYCREVFVRHCADTTRSRYQFL